MPRSGPTTGMSTAIARGASALGERIFTTTLAAHVGGLPGDQ